MYLWPQSNVARRYTTTSKNQISNIFHDSTASNRRFTLEGKGDHHCHPEQIVWSVGRNEVTTHNSFGWMWWICGGQKMKLDVRLLCWMHPFHFERSYQKKQSDTFIETLLSEYTLHTAFNNNHWPSRLAGFFRRWMFHGAVEFESCMQQLTSALAPVEEPIAWHLHLKTA